MTVGSLFAGIGGFDLGFERAGFEIRWQVESDEFCNRVLAKHWPNVKRYGDIRDVQGSELERVDCIIGGFPCQDISNAGQRAGISGERSGLWRYMADSIRVVRPRYAIVENVAALLIRGMGTVLGDMAEIGRDAEWDCLSACEFGAPHTRERVFIITYAAGERQPKSWERQQNPGGHAQVAYREAVGIVDAVRRRALPHVCRRHDGISSTVDAMRGLGNAVCPDCAEWIARRILEAEGHRMKYAVILTHEGEYKGCHMDSLDYAMAHDGRRGSVHVDGIDPGMSHDIAENLNNRKATNEPDA